MSTGVILLAAGSGKRFGGKTPKQFLKIKNKPLLLWSVNAFSQVRSIRQMVVVGHPSFLPKIGRLLKPYHRRFLIRLVPGGSYRGESVRNGLMGFLETPSLVLVHDAARPFVTSDIIKRVERGAAQTGAALAAWPLADTLKKSGSTGLVQKTVPRQNLWQAQTPQGFSWKVAYRCLAKPSPTATDDVELAERRGFKVKLVLGSSSNIKVTVPQDLK